MSARTASGGLTARRAVRLVMARELATRLRSRAFVISNAVLLVVIVGGIVIASIVSSGSDDADKVLAVGPASSLTRTLSASGKAFDHPLEIVSVDDESTARRQVADGEAEVALVARAGGGYTAVTQDQVGSRLRAVLDDAVRQQAVQGALDRQGVDPQALAAETSTAVVTVDALDPPRPDSGERTALAYVAALLLYLQLLANGLAVATGVVEEKTSRVVEVLLSTIEPLHLLAGKIIGIGIIGLAQLAAYGAAGLVAGLATGLLTVTGPAVAVFASALAWYVLGFAFFATLYAAAASLVSRQEEVASTTAPLTVLVLGMFFVAQSAVQDPTGTVSEVMSWIPPFSAILMPLRIAAGVTSGVQVAGTVVLMLVATAVLAGLAAKVYERSVLTTGTRVSWKQAIGRG